MKTKYLLLAAFLAPLMLFAKDERNYLAGAVPEVEGKIVFAKEFVTPDADAAYDKLFAWLDERLKANENNSAIVSCDKSKGQIIAVGMEYLVFADKALSLDRTLMTYYIYVTVNKDKTSVRIERIRFTYEGKKYPAEDYISDDVALNRDRTAIVIGYKKFRVKTIDFIDNFFADVSTALKEQ
jgi:hypothetical protein